MRPKVVSERLGHASIGITLDTFSHVMPGMQEEEAEKIDVGQRGPAIGFTDVGASGSPVTMTLSTGRAELGGSWTTMLCRSFGARLCHPVQRLRRRR